MTSWLLKLLGVDATGVVKVAFSLRGGISPTLFLLLAAGLTAGVFWLYRRTEEPIPALRRHTMATLRSAFLVLLLALLLRPMLTLTLEGTVRRSLLFLFDSSSSMKLQDRRSDDADLQRAAIATGAQDARKGLLPSADRSRTAGLERLARIEVVQAALKNPQINLMPRIQKDFEIAAYTFDRNLADFATEGIKPGATTAPATPTPTEKKPPLGTAWVDRLPATGTQTAIGDAVRDLLDRKRGQPVAGIVLVTDGGNNAGGLPVEAGQLAAEAHIPLFIYGVGITLPRDVIVSNLFCQETAFVRDSLSVTVRVKSTGMAGQTGKLVLRLGDQKVVERDVALQQNGEEVVTLQFTPEQVGDFTLSASIAPQPDEAVLDNNVAAKHLRVIDGRIKVLQVETGPRWEYKYLQAMLERDRRVVYKTVLLEADASITETPNSPYLKAFPANKEELFAYDLVILGDLDLGKSLTTAQMENLEEFVAKFGGAVIVLPGRRFGALAYKKTPLENLLPVECDSSVAVTASANADKPIRLELTAAGKSSPMLRLADSEKENAAKWAALPPVFWTARVSRPKPAAQVLLVDPDPAKASRFGKMPVMAFQQYGMGQVLYVGTDNTWRWRKNGGDRDHLAVWSQSVQRMSLSHLLGAAKRTQLTIDRENFTVGDRITVYARLYGNDFKPVTDTVVRGQYAPRGENAGAGQAVTLRPLPDQPGMYRGDFVAPAAGVYGFSVERDPKTQLSFAVADPQLESGDTAMNETLLKDMAKASGGRFFREEDLTSLPEHLQSHTEHVRSTREVDLWCTPAYFLILLALAPAEWVLRKLSQLK